MERAGRCHRDVRAVDPPFRASTSDNAVARFTVRAARAGIFAAALGAAALGGCSLSIPVRSVDVDGAATGSIDRTAALMPPSLDGEDLRRARAAMAVALDPQGNGSRVGWQNPQTGAHGAFAAARPPYADHDRVCRAFTGDVTPAGGGEDRLRGAACREVDGTWIVQRAG